MSAIVSGLTGFISLDTATSLLTMFAPYIVGAIALGFVVNLVRRVINLGRRDEHIY